MLQGGLGEGGDKGGGGDQCYRVVFLAQQFGDHAAHVIMVIIIDDEVFALGPFAIQDIIGRQDIGGRVNRDGPCVVAGHAVAAPA